MMPGPSRTSDGDQILPHHEQMLLVESGLPVDVVRERGYFSAKTKAELNRLGFAPNQCLAPALVIPIHGVSGNLSGYQIRPDRPRMFENGRTAKYEHPRGSSMVIDVPRRCQPALGNPAIPLYITEGAKKADALAAAGVCAVALSGVWNWRGTNGFGGKAALADWESIALNDRMILIVYDSDVATKEPVAVAMHRLKKFLESRGARVRLVYLPPTASGDKQGIDDFLAAGGTIEQLAQMTQEAVQFPPKQPGDDRPQIVVSDRDVPELAAEAWDALRADEGEGPTLFRRGTQLVSLSPRLDRGMELSAVSQDLLAFHLYRRAVFCRFTREGELKPTKIPRELLADMCVHPNPPVPECRAVVHSPVFAHDGTLHATGGYDPSTELYLDLNGLELPEVQTDPDSGDVTEAVTVLREMVRDFPFARVSCRAHVIAAMITPLVREMFRGPVPLFVFDAPTPGTGKTLLAKIVGLVVTGTEPAMMTQVFGEEERKRITALLQKGPEIAVIDNVKHKLDSPNLDSLLTTEHWSDRLLGTSNSITLPNRTLWMATGNNVRLDGEIARRAVTIRLDAKVDRPYERTGFTHGNPLQWTTEHRVDLLRALVVLVRSWQSRGSPEFEGTPLGSFENWSRIVGGILQCAGVEGFLADRDEVYAQADDESQEWREFVAAWYEANGCERVRSSDLSQLIVERELLPHLVTRIPGEVTLAKVGVRLGKVLSAQRDRRVGDFFIRRAGQDGHSKSTLYVLELAEGVNAGDQPPANPPHETEGDLSSNAEDAEGAEDDFNAHVMNLNDVHLSEISTGTSDQPPHPPHLPPTGSNPVLNAAEDGVGRALTLRNEPPQGANRCSLCGLPMTKERYGTLCRFCHQGGRGQP